MGISENTSAPVTCEIGDKTYRLYPLRALDWGVIERWMRSTVIASSKAAIVGDNDLRQSDKEAIMKAANKTAAQISLMSCFGVGTGPEETTYAFLYSFEGMLHVVHQALRDSSAKDAKNVFTIEELDEMVGGDFEKLSDLFTEAISISFQTMGVAE